MATFVQTIDPKVGIDFAKIDVLPTTPYTNATSGNPLVAQFYPGERQQDSNGTTFLYVKFAVVVTQYNIYPIDTSYFVQTAVATATVPKQFGVVVTANASTVAAGNYGWVAVSGPIAGLNFDAVAYTALNKVYLSATVGKVSATSGVNALVVGLVGIASANATTVAGLSLLPMTVSAVNVTNS